MSEKKNIVIKVKYPSPGKVSESVRNDPYTVTEWNFKRLGAVLAGLALITLAFMHFRSSDDDQINAPVQPIESVQFKENLPPPEKANPPEKVNKVEEPKQVVVSKVSGNSPAIIRALLTKKVEKNEPGAVINFPLKIGRKESVGVYYFVELRGMKGKTVYHEWILNDNLVSRKKVNISADPWRTSSKQAISYTMNNDWKVRIVDDAGNNLSEKTFNLELK